MSDVLIVGGGQGGAQLALALRQQKFSGSITIVGEESELPYERPPLSKEYLAGEKPFDRMQFRTREGWAQRHIDVQTGIRIEAVDATAHEVITDSGSRIHYSKLVWAAGGHARKLQCAEGMCHVHSVRTKDDVDRIRDRLSDTSEIVVIGGGYIGLESAAVLTKLGKKVTVLESADRVLSRVAGEPLSRFYEDEHRSHGVDVRLGSTVKSVTAQAVELHDGAVIPAQMIIVGIGISPAIAPLSDAGATANNGVRVDEQCRTSLADVFAIGDCAEHRNPYAAGDWVRLESVQNAVDQANVVARHLTGQDVTYSAVPWFWSNQYDLRLQTVGLSGGYDTVVRRGDIARRSFSDVYLRRGAVIAVDCVNAVRDYVQGKALVMAHTRVDLNLLGDPAVPLNALADATSNTSN